MESRKDLTFCPCGLPLENGLCKRHKNKPPVKREKQPHLRGKSVWAENEGYFTGLKE